MANIKISICGPHSTGKTTLLKDVIKHLGDIKVVDEVARGIIRNFGWNRDDFLPDKNPDTFFKLNSEIIKEQIHQDIANSQAGQGFICDRALDPIVYVKFYLGEEARERILEIDGVKEWLKRNDSSTRSCLSKFSNRNSKEWMRSSFVFLLSPHEECIRDDSVRLVSPVEELQKLFIAFEEELKSHNIPFHRIKELDRNVRVEQVVRVIKNSQNVPGSTTQD